MKSISMENTAGQRSRELGTSVGLKEVQVFRSTRRRVIGDDLEKSPGRAMLCIWNFTPRDWEGWIKYLSCIIPGRW